MSPPQANKSRYINFALTGINLLRFQHPDRLIILPLRVETLSLLFEWRFLWKTDHGH